MIFICNKYLSAKHFVGKKFCHLLKILTLLADEVFTNKVLQHNLEVFFVLQPKYCSYEDEMTCLSGLANAAYLIALSGWISPSLHIYFPVQIIPIDLFW